MPLICYEVLCNTDESVLYYFSQSSDSWSRCKECRLLLACEIHATDAGGQGRLDCPTPQRMLVQSAVAGELESISGVRAHVWALHGENPFLLLPTFAKAGPVGSRQIRRANSNETLP